MKKIQFRLLLVFLLGVIVGVITYVFTIDSIANSHIMRGDFQPQKLDQNEWTCTELLSSRLDEIDIKSNNQPIVQITKPFDQHKQTIMLAQNGNQLVIDYLDDQFEAEIKDQNNETVFFDFTREKYAWVKTQFSAALNKATGFLVLNAVSHVNDRDTGRVSGFQKAFVCR